MTGGQLARMIETAKKLPARERTAVVEEVKSITTAPGLGVSKEAAFEMLARVISARGRTLSRAAVDRRGRVLVGARVSRTRAEGYRAAARLEGISLYAWVCRALDARLIESANEVAAGEEPQDI